MKKTFLLIGGFVSLLLFATTVSATNNADMNSFLSNLTSKSKEEIVELRNEMTYGEIAKEENVYEEFKEAKITAKIAHIERKVEEGKITSNEAEQFISRFLEKSENCDGNRVEMKFGNGKRNQ